jgi:hypothetical protein
MLNLLCFDHMGYEEQKKKGSSGLSIIFLTEACENDHLGSFFSFLHIFFLYTIIFFFETLY